jgi:hypothetical protein
MGKLGRPRVDWEFVYHLASWFLASRSPLPVLL